MVVVYSARCSINYEKLIDELCKKSSQKVNALATITYYIALDKSLFFSQQKLCEKQMHNLR